MRKVLAKITVPQINFDLSLELPHPKSSEELIGSLIKQLEIHKQVSHGTDEQSSLSLSEIKKVLEGMKYDHPSEEQKQYIHQRNDIIDQCVYRLTNLM